MIIPLNIHAGAFLLCFRARLLLAAVSNWRLEQILSWFFDYGMFSHRNGNNFCGYSCSVPYHMNPFLLLKELFFMLLSLRHKPWERQWASCLDRQEPAFERLRRPRRYSPWGHQRAGVQWNRMAWNRQNTAYPSVKLTPTQSKIPTPSIPFRLDGVFYKICFFNKTKIFFLYL